MNSFIVAEIGVNFSCLETAEEMIALSKLSGADCVKFQVFDESVIAGYSEPLKSRLTKMVLSKDDLVRLKSVSDRYGIEFMATPMFREAVDWLDPLVSKFKVRYADRMNLELINYILYKNKPVYISTDKLLPYSHDDFIYCVPKYPPELSDIKLPRFRCVCGNGYSRFTGYSNHYPHPELAMIALSRGARYVEVHVKSSNTCIDHAVSLSFDQLGVLCRYRKLFEMQE